MAVFKEEYEVIDGHGHPGFEKKDIENRPGWKKDLTYDSLHYRWCIRSVLLILLFYS